MGLVHLCLYGVLFLLLSMWHDFDHDRGVCVMPDDFDVDEDFVIWDEVLN